MKRNITPDDILPLDVWAEIRRDRRRALMELKALRRIEVGPFATVQFECWHTMWFQVQEMLWIEKGGTAQLPGELAAYNPLVPKGDELVATVMLGIEDEARRQRVLAGLGGIEDSMELRFAGDAVRGVPEGDIERTNEDGKTSSVHFLHFRFTPPQIARFRARGTEVTFAVGHPGYRHLAVLPEAVRGALSDDFG
jgi:hypothetical protein